MHQQTHLRPVLGFAGLSAALLTLIFWNIGAGSVHLPLGEIWKTLIYRQGEHLTIILDMRLPRILAVLLLGGALSLSGFLLQTFFSNPIAGPFILGVSSGAKLVLSLTLIGFLSHGIAVGSFALILAAFLGAMLSMGFVLAVSVKAKQMSVLIIAGVMIGYICSAITDFVVTFADDANIINLHHWSLGSFSGMSWENVGVMTAVVIPALLLTFLLSKPISAYQLGEVYAQNMGVNIRRFRIALILLSSVLAACVTAFAGPISFVGVAVPHLVRSIFKTEKPLFMVPACFLGGAVFCLFCDLIARTAFSPTELSISSVTAIFGAPVVIFVMLRRQKTMSS
ncbi:MAG: FecCD family ABC transporter permease [bacterium]